jgi:hypothetical protein
LNHGSRETLAASSVPSAGDAPGNACPRQGHPGPGNRRPPTSGRRLLRAEGGGLTTGRRTAVANQHSPGPPLAARFWAKVNRDGPEHPALGRCWAWADSNRGGLLGSVDKW